MSERTPPRPSGWALRNGELVPLHAACVPVTDPGFTLGWTVFETMEAVDGTVPELSAHLKRLQASAQAAVVAMPAASLLAEEVEQVVAAQGGLARVRITLSGSGFRVITATPLSTDRRHAPVHAVRGVYAEEPYLGGRVKHGSRAPWVVAVKRSGVDEVLLVDHAGRFVEGTSSGVVAVVGGEVWSAPDDGRLLPSTTVKRVLRTAVDLGLVVHRRAPSAEGPWDALYVASATRHLAPVVLLDGVALPGWDPVGRALAGRG